jgi:hypothetical protein
MHKIVEAFVPKTGQVYKDKQCQLKVQVVVDLPINASLIGANEYKEFFELTKHLNNYHPNIKDVAFQFRHYNPIRYQTKLYEERVNNLRIFSEEEQEFLQYYYCSSPYLLDTGLVPLNVKRNLPIQVLMY